MAQASAGGCARDLDYHKLDFWLGSWKVFSAKGAKSADVKISSILDGCGISEDWKSAHGANGRGLAGYDRRTRKWNYFWLSATGALTHLMEEKGSAGSVQFSVTQNDTKGMTRLRRWTLSVMPRGGLRELSMGSADNGKSWTKEYELFWRR